MFKKTKQLLRKIKNRKLVLKKAGLREHIIQRKASGKKRRVYTNKEGEKFIVERQLEWKAEMSSMFSIHITKHGTKLPYASGTIKVDPEYKRLKITTLGLHETESIGSGRNFLGIAIDECKQLGLKYFGGHGYEISIRPRTAELKKYYTEQGFKKKKDSGSLHMKIK